MGRCQKNGHTKLTSNNKMNENKEKKKSPFSIYWIYAIIVISIIGIQLFMSGTSDVKIRYQSTFFTLADSSYISDVKLVNREKFLKLELKVQC